MFYKKKRTIKIIYILCYFTFIWCQCDFNEDTNLDILDITGMVNCILEGCYDGSQCDPVEDGSLDVLDIIITVNCILDECWQACIDIDGNIYETVHIGDQLWMAENLKVTHYRNGDNIQYILNDNDWCCEEIGKYGLYDNIPENVDTYGYLYNWYAIDMETGICPEGWHVPTDDELQELEISIGMDPEEANSTGWRGIDEGGKMKLSGFEYWWEPNTGATNESGFSAIPGGYRFSNTGEFNLMGSYAYLWVSSDLGASNAYARYLSYEYATIYRNVTNKQFGFSIRCISD